MRADDVLELIEREEDLAALSIDDVRIVEVDLEGDGQGVGAVGPVRPAPGRLLPAERRATRAPTDAVDAPMGARGAFVDRGGACVGGGASCWVARRSSDRGRRASGCRRQVESRSAVEAATHREVLSKWLPGIRSGKRGAPTARGRLGDAGASVAMEIADREKLIYRAARGHSWSRQQLARGRGWYTLG